MAEPIEQLIQQANANIAIITTAFGNNGDNLTRVITNNKNIDTEIINMYRVIESYQNKITELFTQLSNATSNEEFQQLEQQIRAFLVRFNELIPTLELNRFYNNDGDDNFVLNTEQQIHAATSLVTNIRNKAYAYVKKGPNYKGTNEEFIRISNLVKGAYTREGNAATFKNDGNNNDTRITFGVLDREVIPDSIIVDGTRSNVVANGGNFTTIINNNPYFLTAYSFENIPRTPQIAGSKRKRRRKRTRKNKRKSRINQKGGFGYNNKIPSSKKKSSKRSSSTNSSSSSKTTSSSK